MVEPTDQPLETVYHVFTDYKDMWVADYRLARHIFDHWKKANSVARLYREVYSDRENDVLEEECLLSYGDFPL